MIVITIIAIILAIAATVLALIFIAPDKKRERLNGLGKFVHDTINFKYLIIEKILQVLYILCTAYVILMGFFMLFYVRPGYDFGYYKTSSTWYGGYGLLVMVVGPIAIRLAYEALMMAFLLVKNVIQINSKLKSNGQELSDNKFRKNEYFTSSRRPAPQNTPPAAPYGSDPQYASPAAPYGSDPQYASPAAPYGNVPKVEVAPGNANSYANTNAQPSAVCPRCGAKVEGQFCGVCGTRLQ